MVIMSGAMPSVIMSSVIVLSVVAPKEKLNVNLNFKYFPHIFQHTRCRCEKKHREEAKIEKRERERKIRDGER